MKVWYVLSVDENDQGADKVNLEEGADVADFRDAVHAKSTGILSRNKFSEVAASDLRVYESKKHYSQNTEGMNPRAEVKAHENMAYYVIVDPAVVQQIKAAQTRSAGGNGATPSFMKRVEARLGEEIDKVHKRLDFVNKGASGGVTTHAQFYQRILDRKLYDTFSISACSDTRLLFPKPSIVTKTSKGKTVADMSETNYVQPYWNAVLPKICKSRESSLKSLPASKFDAVSFGLRKPDTVCYKKLENGRVIQNVMHITMIGDNKKERKEGSQMFTDEEKGHLLDMMRCLIHEQPFRFDNEGNAFAVGFLCDTSIVQFFTLTVNVREESLSVAESKVERLDDSGGRILIGLFEANMESIGYTLPDISAGNSKIELTNLLGIGGSSIVYAGSMPDEGEVVVKVFKEDMRAMLKREQLMLTRIADLDATRDSYCFTSFVVSGSTESKADDTNVLILRPRGIPFALSHDSRVKACVGRSSTSTMCYAYADDFCNLIDALELLHCNNLVHRDIKLSNIFITYALDGKERFLLNDIGSATERGVQCMFAGCLQHAPEDILRAHKENTEYTPSAWHDLHMVVCTVVQQWYPEHYDSVRLEHDPATIILFWNDFSMRLPILAKLFVLANECNYAELKLEIAAYVCKSGHVTVHEPGNESMA